MTPKLLTIPYSHFCEKARWALDRAGVDYVEEGHAPILHVPHVRWAAGQTSVPVYIDAAGTHADSTDILRHLDASLPPERRLFPEGDADVARLEDQLDVALGPATRTLGYFYAFQDLKLTGDMAGREVSRLEALVVRGSLPLAVVFLRQVYSATPEGAAHAGRVIEETLDALDARLADGRRYLCGDRFTAADLTFAALMTPILVPPESGAPYPAREALPEPWRVACDQTRERPSGALVMRLYAEERR
ncbi:MAG: glutathione S-transferase [Alphaproteobacteria bacterium]|nr:glutathione S-transferase [Alphaproteobacteria bacterium]